MPVPCRVNFSTFFLYVCPTQGILKGEVSMYRWPPVWLVSNQLYDNSFCFCLQNRLIQTSQTGGQWYSDTSPFSIPWSYNLHALCMQFTFHPTPNGRFKPETFFTRGNGSTFAFAQPAPIVPCSTDSKKSNSESNFINNFIIVIRTSHWKLACFQNV
jgi:hypothetical protein